MRKRKSDAPIERKAAINLMNEIINSTADMVNDMATDIVYIVKQGQTCGMPKYDKMVKKLKKENVQNIQGYIADELYSDVDILTDIVGDRLWEETDDNDVLRNTVIYLLIKKGGIWSKVARRLER